MKHSEIDIKDLVFGIIKKSSISSSISGKVYKDKRPMNSKKEDMVISVLASDSEQVQQFTVTANLYVQDVRRENEYVENTPRLRELCSICSQELDRVARADCLVRMDSQRIHETQTNEHCISNRLNIRIHETV